MRKFLLFYSKLTGMDVMCNLDFTVKPTSEGFMASVDCYPIVVEASDMNSLALSLIKTIAVYAVNYPKEAIEMIQIAEKNNGN